MASNCEMCETEAKFHCKDCDVALCPLHIQEHKDQIPDFPHTVVSLTRNCEMCEKEAKFHCSDCDVSLCALHIKEHKEQIPGFPHKIVPLKKPNVQPIPRPVPGPQPRPRPSPNSCISIPVPSNYRLYVPYSRQQLFAKWMTDDGTVANVQLSQKVKVTSFTVSIVLPDGNLFCCGGKGKRQSRTALINSTSGEVTSLPNMNLGRSNPGLVYVNGIAYIFGGVIHGVREENKTGEKFKFDQGQWINLQNQMQNSRYQFTPCAYGRTIYLAGGFHTTSVEVFDVPSETFSTLPLVLPKPACAICFVHNNQLIVVQEFALVRWTLNSQTGNAVTQSLPNNVKDSNIGVQIKGTKAYFSCERGDTCAVFELNLNDWSLTKTASMGNFPSDSQSVIQSGPVAIPVATNYRVFIPFSRGPQLAKCMADNAKLERVMLSEPLNFTNVTVSLVLPDGNMFSCGGRNEHETRTVLINTSSGAVTRLANMKTGRGNPGIVYVNGVVYAFGGACSETVQNHTSAEKFGFQQNQWTLLQNKMANDRFQFMPFAHQNTVYIAGGWHTTSVEAFNISTETFSTLPLVLPITFASTCLVHNNQLLVLQQKTLIRWNLNSRSGEYQSQAISKTAKDSNVGVQIRGEMAYFTSEGGNKCKILQLNLQNWELKKLASLSGPGGPQGCPVS